MRQFLILLFAFFISINAISQILEGKVYDQIATVKGIKVINKTQNSVTATDEEGNFLIIAKVSDTIAFESLFHEPKSIVLRPYHFESETVFELTQIINELDEVEIKDRPKDKEFNLKTYNTDLKNLIKEDIKNNPGLYAPINNNQGIDFVYLFKKLFDLIKKKKPKANEPYPVTYEQLIFVFEQNNFFNKNLLVKDLKIPEERINLFLEFCSAKEISSELLKEEKKMALLEELVVNSQLFLILLDTYGEAKATKD